MLIRERNVHFLRFSANTINLVLDPFFFCNILYKPVPLFVDSPANRIARRKLQKLRPPQCRVRGNRVARSFWLQCNTATQKNALYSYSCLTLLSRRSDRFCFSLKFHLNAILAEQYRIFGVSTFRRRFLFRHIIAFTVSHNARKQILCGYFHAAVVLVTSYFRRLDVPSIVRNFKIHTIDFLCTSTLQFFLQNKQIVDYFTSNQVADTSLYTLARKIYDMSEAIEQF